MKQIIRNYYILEAGKCSCEFPCVGSDGGGHDDRADHSGEQAGHQGTGGLGGEFDERISDCFGSGFVSVRIQIRIRTLQLTLIRLRIRLCHHTASINLAFILSLS
jgi:hypothetical protein